MPQTHIGLKVLDKDSLQSAIIQPAPLTDVGIMIRSQRGVIGKAKRVLSVRDLNRRFGDASSTLYGVTAIKAMFDNATPFSAVAWVERIESLTDVTLAAATTNVDAVNLRVIPAPTGATIVLNGSGHGITVTAGTIANTVTISIDGTIGGTPTNNIYTDVAADQIVGAINYGLYGYTRSNLINVDYFGGALPAAVAETLIPPAGLSLGVAANTITVTAGQEGDPDPGTWGNSYGVQFLRDGNDPEKRQLVVYKKVNGDWVAQGQAIVGLTLANFLTRINGESPYVYIDETSITNLPAPMASPEALAGGADSVTALVAADYTGNSTNKAGFYAFDDKGITNLILADNMSDTYSIDVLRSMDLHLENNNSRCLCHYNFDSTVTAAVALGVKTLLRKKSWLSCYIGWGTIFDTVLGDQWIPMIVPAYGSGFVKKMLNDPSQLPHIAPGGNESAVAGVKRLSTEALGDAELLDLVKNVGINPFQTLANIGHVLRTSRTMSTDSRQYDIHKRRSINFIGGSLQGSMGWIEQSPNNPQTRRKITDQIGSFLSGLYSRGMFSPEQGYAGAVQIKCDEENNPPDQVVQRILECEVKVKIVDVIETAVINLRSEDKFLSVDESNT